MRARKRFGQHFLHDPVILERIVRLIRPRPGEHLVEIGPGQGALTRPLLDAAGQLDVVEIDRDLAAALRADAGLQDRVRVHEADALEFDWGALARSRGGALRIVGNLPYNISTPLLFRLLGYREHISDMHFLLQREVVERIVAAPGGGEYGRLGVMLAPFVEATSLLEVGPGASVRPRRSGRPWCAWTYVPPPRPGRRIRPSLQSWRRPLASGARPCAMRSGHYLTPSRSAPPESILARALKP